MTVDCRLPTISILTARFLLLNFIIYKKGVFYEKNRSGMQGGGDYGLRIAFRLQG